MNHNTHIIGPALFQGQLRHGQASTHPSRAYVLVDFTALIISSPMACKALLGTISCDSTSQASSPKSSCQRLC